MFLSGSTSGYNPCSLNASWWTTRIRLVEVKSNIETITDSLAPCWDRGWRARCNTGYRWGWWMWEWREETKRRQGCDSTGDGGEVDPVGYVPEQRMRIVWVRVVRNWCSRPLLCTTDIGHSSLPSITIQDYS